jgi:hypothetical protein
MIAEALAGIALFKSAVTGLKSAIGTAKDVSEIGGFINQLFTAEKQINQERNKKAGVSSLDGFRDAASNVIDAKLVQEQLAEVRNLVNMRFGPDTWQSILDEKAKQEREARVAAAEAKRIAIQKQDNILEAVYWAVCIGLGIFAFGLFIYILMEASNV